MKFQIVSDLHCEFRVPDVPAAAEVIVAAGDIGSRKHALPLIDRWLAAGAQVILVLGNHEYYGREMSSTMRRWREWSDERPGLNWIDRGPLVLGDVRFLGATLWTDFDQGNRAALHNAREGLRDYQVIRHNGRRFHPTDALTFHRRDRAWLEAALVEEHEGPTVVVTHHAPHPRSLPGESEGDELNPAYASDLSALMAAHRPQLWIHGHVHEARDYYVHDTRVICNPLGYPGQDTGWDPSRIIEL